MSLVGSSVRDAVARGLAFDHSTAVLVMRVSSLLHRTHLTSLSAIRFAILVSLLVLLIAMLLAPLLRPLLFAPGLVSGRVHVASPVFHSAHSIPLLRRLALASALVLFLAVAPALRFPSALFAPFSWSCSGFRTCS